MFKHFHQNVQYISNKITQLEIFINEEIPEVLIFTEHGLKENKIDMINFDLYKLGTYYCRSIHKSRGVIIYWKITLNVTKFNLLNQKSKKRF